MNITDEKLEALFRKMGELAQASVRLLDTTAKLHDQNKILTLMLITIVEGLPEHGPLCATLTGGTCNCKYDALRVSVRILFPI